MKLNIKYLLLFAVLILGSNNLLIAYEGDNEIVVNYEQIITVQPTGDTRKFKLIVIIPDDYEYRQEVTDINFSLEPESIYYEGDNKYAEFVLENLDSETEIIITSEIKVLNYDLGKLAKSSEILPLVDDNITQYLIDEQYLEVNNRKLEKLAESLIGDSNLQTINNIYDFVLSHVEYGGYEPGDLGALHVFKSGYGDCTEYSDLFITLCRINNIPAKFIEGYTLTGTMYKHNWVEVYDEQFGWFPVDPTWGDTDDITTFSNLRNNYIYLSFKRNDEIINYYHFSAWWWWGDEVLVDVNENITQQ